MVVNTTSVSEPTTKSTYPIERPTASQMEHPSLSRFKLQHIVMSCSTIGTHTETISSCAPVDVRNSMLSLLGRRNLVGTGSPSNFLGADHASTKVPIEEIRNERTST